MRKLIAIPILAIGGLLASGPSAEALCRTPDALVQRYQQKDTATTMVLVDRQVVGPALPGQVGPIRIYPYPPTGPLTRFSFKVVRVYEGGDQDLRAGTILTRTERPFEGRPPEPVGTREATFLDRTARGWELPLTEWGECGGLYSFTPELLREAALLDRYARGRNAESFGCSREGLACWSIKRRGRDAVLRAASYSQPAKTDRVCVTAPDRSRSCKRLALKPDTGLLRSSRVGWSRNFPHKGHGRYRVTWYLNQVPLDQTITGSPEHPHLRGHLPELTFLR